MKAFITFLLYIGLYGLQLNAQYTISGTVTNEKGESLDLALVYLMGTEYAVTTNAQGEFRLENVEEGLYKIKVSYLGYESVTEEIDVIHDLSWDVIMRGIIFDLDAIEIRGTWSTAKSPFSFENYSQEDFKELNTGVDVPFVFRYTPSVVVHSDAGNGIGYTGIRVRGADPSRTNVTINGIPLNDAESQLVFWVDLPDFMSSVSEVQIQRGVGSSTIGNAAFGANINLNTKTFHINPFVNINSSVGSYNTRKISASLGTGLMNSKVALEGRYSRILSDGYINRASSSLQSYMITGQYLTPKSALYASFFSGNEITYQAWNGVPAQFLESDRTYNTAGTQKPGDPYPTEVDNYEQTHMQLHYDYELSGTMVLNLAIHYTRGLGFFENYLAGQNLENYLIPDTTNQDYDLVTRRWLSNHFYGTSYSVQHRSRDQRSRIVLNGAVNRYSGFHYGQVVWNNRDYEELDSLFAGRTSPVSYYENDAIKTEINHFIKWDYDISSKLNAYVDLQHRYVKYTIDGSLKDNRSIQVGEKYHFFNPKVGINYQLTPKLNSYLSYAIANREPNRNDFTAFSSEGLANPERLNNFELGSRFNTEATQLGVNLYYMIYRDQLVLTGRINDVGEYIRENVPNSYRRGLEISIHHRYTSVLDWNANLNFSQNQVKKYSFYRDDWDTGGQEAIILENTELSFSPNVIASNQLEYTAFSHDFLEQSGKISLRTKYVGAQYLDNTSSEYAKLDPYLNNDLAFSYRLKPKFTQGITLHFTIYNVLNAKYVSNGWIYRFNSSQYNPIPDDPYALAELPGQYNLTGYFPQAERNYMLSLSVKL